MCRSELSLKGFPLQKADKCCRHVSGNCVEAVRTSISFLAPRHGCLYVSSQYEPHFLRYDSSYQAVSANMHNRVLPMWRSPIRLSVFVQLEVRPLVPREWAGRSKESPTTRISIKQTLTWYVLDVVDDALDNHMPNPLTSSSSTDTLKTAHKQCFSVEAPRCLFKQALSLPLTVRHCLLSAWAGAPIHLNHR